MAAFRYWRLNITKWRAYDTGADGITQQVRIGDMRFLKSDDAFWPTSALTSDSAPSPFAASVSSSSGAGFEAFRAFDGAFGDASRWISATNPGSAQWLQIDLGSAQDFNRFQIGIDSDIRTFPVDFQILASDTGAFAGEEITRAFYVGVTTGWAIETLRTFTLNTIPANINTTLPMLGSAVAGAASFIVSLPPLAVNIGGAARVNLAVPALLAVIRGGAQAGAILPMMTTRVVALAGEPSGITATLPSLFATARSGAAINVGMPKLQLASSATVFGWAQIAATLPALRADGSGRLSGVVTMAVALPALQTVLRNGGQIAAKLPAVKSVLSGLGGGVINLAATLPAMQAASSGTAQNRGSIAAVLPMLKRVGAGRINVILPTLQVSVAGGEVIAVTYEAYAINLGKTRQGQPYEATKYSNFPFTKIVRWKDGYYGVAADGLYLLGGDTDAGAPIASSWQTHLANFNALQKKTPESMYLSGRMGPSAVGIVAEGEKAVYSYPMANLRGEASQVYRVKMGKGIKSNYLGFGAADPDGGVMDIDLMDDRIPVLTRNI